MSKTAHILAVNAMTPHTFLPCSYTPLPEGDILNRLDMAGTYIGPRQMLEDDERFRQIIPYVILRKDMRFATYTRGASGNEARLHGKLAIGVGGHIDLEDVDRSHDGSICLSNTLSCAAKREIAEEVVIRRSDDTVLPVETQGHFTPKWRGLLVDSSNAVGRVHIGVVGVVDIFEHLTVHPGEDSQEDIQWLTARELEANHDRLESWTEILLPYLHQL